MNIALLNASISRKAGGVFEVQRRLAQNLLEIPGVDISIYGLKDEQTDNDLPLWLPFVPVVHPIKGITSFGYSPSLTQSLKTSGADIIHLHVIWMYPSIAVMHSGIPYITTIHGMLDKWAVQNSRLKKSIAGFLYENAALKKAKCLQAFTMQEYKDIRSYGLKNPVCVVPNGVDLPGNVDELKSKPPVWSGTIPAGKKVLLYLGRIHPKKGLYNLIQAWKTLTKSNSRPQREWVLAIAGWGQGQHEADLIQLVKEAGLTEQIFFLGPQFNTAKDLCFAHANAFILPSFSEGLPMAVLEAWSFSLPVVMTAACNLPEGFNTGAAILISTQQQSIADGLVQLFTGTSEEHYRMGSAGKELVAERFNWQNVSKSIFDVYQWSVGAAPKPEQVFLT